MYVQDEHVHGFRDQDPTWGAAVSLMVQCKLLEQMSDSFQPDKAHAVVEIDV